MIKIKHLAIQSVFVCCFTLPLLAESGNGTTHPSKLENLLWALIPLVVIGLLVYWLLRGVTRGQRGHIERYQQHMDRVEQSLDRIARALEKKDTGAA